MSSRPVRSGPQAPPAELRVVHNAAPAPEPDHDGSVVDVRGPDRRSSQLEEDGLSVVPARTAPGADGGRPLRGAYLLDGPAVDDDDPGGDDPVDEDDWAAVIGREPEPEPEPEPQPEPVNASLAETGTVPAEPETAPPPAPVPAPRPLVRAAAEPAPAAVDLRKTPPAQQPPAQPHRAGAAPRLPDRAGERTAEAMGRLIDGVRQRIAAAEASQQAPTKAPAKAPVKAPAKVSGKASPTASDEAAPPAPPVLPPPDVHHVDTRRFDPVVHLGIALEGLATLAPPRTIIARLMARLAEVFGSDVALLRRRPAGRTPPAEEDGPLWDVVGGAGLRPLEMRPIDALPAAAAALGGERIALCTSQTDELRAQLIGLPLARHRSLLVMRHPEDLVLVAGRSVPFGAEDVARAGEELGAALPWLVRGWQVEHQLTLLVEWLEG